MKYRKRPVIIEAIEHTGELSRVSEILDWINGGPGARGVATYAVDQEGLPIFIETLEGRMRADRGDFIIRGVQGEFYPCKPDIFVATYEAV